MLAGLYYVEVTPSSFEKRRISDGCYEGCVKFQEFRYPSLPVDSRGKFSLLKGLLKAYLEQTFTKVSNIGTSGNTVHPVVQNAGPTDDMRPSGVRDILWRYEAHAAAILQT